ncbi:DUF6765 family protein [uncultured Ferrimonas sp.]|uniref:DUF6765 family protein n=1 Tax=uncultured Ferrimonas sp. TaxID=432640 RepID=UPI00261888CF|nr:DUF6765 family protein [uncultured Ferrimonas sp.]
MQIDGHHTLTYVAARFAQFDHRQAATIAYASQYVCDATNSGLIRFDNGASYSRLASANKMLDRRSLSAMAENLTWLPLYYLPGNGGQPAGVDPDGGFVQKLICQPDSPVARAMLADCIANQDTPSGLHRLGISMHALADSFSHQGFAGVSHEVNVVEEVEAEDQNWVESFTDRLSSFFLAEGFPLGHAAALNNPDKPYLTWRYQNGFGELIERDNVQIFTEAANVMCKAMQAYRQGDVSVNLDAQPGIPSKDLHTIKLMLAQYQFDNEQLRHQHWLGDIGQGRFSFGAAQLNYIGKGIGSWKHQALGQEAHCDSGDERFHYQPAFLSSDWKQFHDALRLHLLVMQQRIFPSFGICSG